MPLITNKKTRRTYPVTEKELDAIRNNPMIAGDYVFPEQSAPVPDELLKAREQKSAAQSASEPEPVRFDPYAPENAQPEGAKESEKQTNKKSRKQSEG